MGMTVLSGTAIGFALVLVGAQPARAQTKTPTPISSSNDRAKLRVFLTEFDQEGVSPSGVDLGDLAKSLMRLQLMGIRGIQVQEAESRRVPCESRIATQAQSKMMAFTATDLFESSTLPTMTISLHAVADSTRVLLDVEVKRCVAGNLTLVKHDDREVGWRSPLAELLALIGSVTRRVQDEIPRTTIAVRALEAPATDSALLSTIAPYATDHVADRIGRLEDARVADAASDTTAEYRVTGRVASGDTKDALDAHIYITPRGSARPLDSTRVLGSRLRLDDFYAELADSTIAHLEHWRQVASLGVTGRLTALTDRALEERARRSLCMDVASPCEVDANAAAAALLSVPVKRRDAALSVLVGKTEQLRGNNALAVTAYRQALRAADTATTRTPRITAATDAALRGLIALLRDAGDNRAAGELYDRLIALAPSDSVIARERALNLRLARRQIASLRALAQLDAKLPGWKQPSADFEATIADTRAEDLADSASAVTSMCTAPSRIHAACVKIVGDKTAQLASVFPRSDRTRALATGLTRIATDDQVKRSEGFAYLAASRLGNSIFQMNPSGEVEHLLTETADLALAVAPLNMADSLAQLSGDVRTREWIARLRSQFQLNSRRYGDAYASAMTSMALKPNDGARLLSTQAALMRGKEATGQRAVAEAKTYYRNAESAVLPLVQARRPSSYFYYREIKHALGEDAAARPLLEAAMSDAPSDDEAPRVLNHLCVEYLKDFACALRAQKLAYQNGGLRSYGDSLGAVETAVVYGDFESGTTWLESLLSRPASACEKSVAFLYATWVAAAKKNEALRAEAEGRFKESLGVYKSEGGVACWLFEGAKAKLSGSSPPPFGAPARTTLLGMIKALEPKPGITP